MKKAAAKIKKPVTSKADFVRSLPADLPARDVVERARNEGIGEITEHYVHNIRSLDRRTTRSDRPDAESREPTGKRTGRSPEDMLRAIAMEMGVSRAIAFLEQERTRARNLLGD